MKYTIVLRSNRVYQAEVEVEADNPHDAEDIALQQVNDDDYEEIDWEADRKSTRLNSSHSAKSRMPSSA